MKTLVFGLVARANGEAQAGGHVGRANAIALDGEGWMDVLWPGRWDHPEGPEVVDAKDIELTLANLTKRAQADGDNWRGVPVYVGHPEKESNGVAAPAVGWVKRFRVDGKTGRLQGLPEWCGDARKELIESKKYKDISAYEWGDLDPQTGIFHTANITSIGLTNFPVKRDGQKPLANADAAGTAAAGAPAAGSGAVDGLALIGRPQGVSDDLAAKVAALIKGATDRDSALRVLMNELQALWTRREEVEAVQTQLNGLAPALGVNPVPAEIAGRVHALTTELQALRSAAAARAQADADPTAGANAPRRTNALPPPGGMAAAAAAAADTAEVAGAVRARANAILTECGGNWERAWARALGELRARAQAAPGGR